MRVKRYIVDTMPDAMMKIRSELGANAVILSTKEMKLGGFLGMFQKKKIEVIAATEGDEPGTPAEKPSLARPNYPVSPPVARQAVPEAYRKSSQLMPAAAPSAVGLQERPESIIKDLTQAPSEYPASSRVAAETGHLGEMPEQRASQPAAAEERNVRSRPASQLTQLSQQDKEEQLLEEIRQMKAWLSQLARGQAERRELPHVLSEFRDHLFVQEVSADLSDPWIEEVYGHWMGSNKTLSDAEMIDKIREVMGNFLEGRFDHGIDERTRIVYIVGPTGVGKTTTIAKLAADQIYRLHKKVGFITADTFRISAVEQLRTYASILNVPLEIVQSPGDVQRAMQRLGHCDLILMDTAGRNYLNELFVAELQSLLIPSEISETYLVLSLTSKTQDMKRIAEHFSKYSLNKVIFTKLDETETVGPIYNLLNEFPLRVSFITNGQNVPDDLLHADRELLIDILLGDKR